MTASRRGRAGSRLLMREVLEFLNDGEGRSGYAIWALSFKPLEANRNLLTAMRLLPKSIHWCRRYPTKFNSGRDIPHMTSLGGTRPHVFAAVTETEPSSQVRGGNRELDGRQDR